MAITWGEYKTRIAARSHKDLTREDESDDVVRYAKSGIELVEAEDSWSWLYKEFTITLASNTYAYDWPNALEKFDANTFRYGVQGAISATRGGLRI